MRKMILFALYAFFAQEVDAQNFNKITPTSKQRRYIAIVDHSDNLRTKGWFFAFSEDSVYLVSPNIRLMEGTKYKNPLLYEEAVAVSVTNINSISFKRKNAGLRGALIGLGAGALVGIIMGLADGDDPVQPYTGGFGDLFIGIGNALAMTAGEKAAIGAMGGGLLGAGAGAIIGAVIKKKFVIGRDKAVYNDLHNELMQRVYIPIPEQWP